MGYSTSAIRKGMAAEHLAKAHFSKMGYVIFEADSHETNFDFIAQKDNEFVRVQVKADCKTKIKGLEYIRFRNKHGQNRKYNPEDYDLLAGVWVDTNTIFIFKSEDVNGEGKGETLTVCQTDGTPVKGTKTPRCLYQGQV